MPTACPLAEFRARWLPHVTDAGLARVRELLRTASPLLVSGTFARAEPMGCLASHIAWNHPVTHASDEAGIRWLAKVARLNPATSAVILAWDRAGPHDRGLRAGLLAECRREQRRRQRAGVTAGDLVGAGW